jgi:hypothetical protein
MGRHGVQVCGPMADDGGGWRRRLGNLPALAQAACATCQLARHAATERSSILTKKKYRWFFLTFHWRMWSFLSKIRKIPGPSFYIQFYLLLN